MTINDVNDFLDEFCRATSSEDKTTTLAKLIKKASVLEQKWIIHIILKDLKIGIGHETVFKQIDSRAQEVYSSTSSLVEVCNFLVDPKNSKYAHSFFRLFAPIKPMLAGRMNLHDIIHFFTGVPVYVETKYDGERIQCHLQNNEVKFFTRNAVDYTYLYGPKLGEVITKSVNAKSAILDGEVVVWDKARNCFAPFGENKPTAHGDEIEKQLVYMIFDILYLVTPKGDEFSLTSVILSDRKQILKRIVNVVPKKLEVVEGVETSSIDEVLAKFNESVTKGEEGIIVKKRDSTYKPDERSVDWIKIKSDYIDSLTDTLDLVIIGGFYGEGKRRIGSNSDWNDHISTFLMGVVKFYDKENPRKSIILPLVKVGTGYSNEELEIMRQRLKYNWKTYDSKKPTSLYGSWYPAMSEKPDVYIEDPSESIILELKAAEITISDAFPTKLTLRFPRVVKVRYDKSCEDAMKYEELLKFNENAQHNQVMREKRKVEDVLPDDIGDLIGKKKKIDKFNKIQESFRDTDTNNINKLSVLFNGLEFLVLNIDDNIQLNTQQKKSLEYNIVENGGTKVQNYLSSTTHVIASKMDIRAQNLLKTKDVNIFNPKWITDSIKYHKLMKVSPLYLTYANKATKELFSQTIDKYNDDYYEYVNKENLVEIFNSMKSVDLSDSMIRDLKERYNFSI
jgi:DNA ligase-4